jgi:hypothetical protein
VCRHGDLEELRNHAVSCAALTQLLVLQAALLFIRMQLDNVLRISAFRLVNDPYALALPDAWFPLAGTGGDRYVRPWSGLPSSLEAPAPRPDILELCRLIGGGFP